MPAGQTPHTTIVYAHNDLVDKVQPGDRVNITGKDGSSEWFGQSVLQCWGWGGGSAAFWTPPAFVIYCSALRISLKCLSEVYF